MNTYSLVGVNPTKIIHKGTINGLKPMIGGAYAEPTVTGGKAEFASLTQGGLFAFDKKAIIVEGLLGTFTIVDPSGTVTRPTPTEFPFKLLPNEWLKAVTGAEVWCIVRLDAQRIL